VTVVFSLGKFYFPLILLFNFLIYSCQEKVQENYSVKP
jgi:hypothetical protein